MDNEGDNNSEKLEKIHKQNIMRINKCLGAYFQKILKIFSRVRLIVKCVSVQL